MKSLGPPTILTKRMDEQEQDPDDSYGGEADGEIYYLVTFHFMQDIDNMYLINLNTEAEDDDDFLYFAYNESTGHGFMKSLGQGKDEKIIVIDEWDVDTDVNQSGGQQHSQVQVSFQMRYKLDDEIDEDDVRDMRFNVNAAI